MFKSTKTFGYFSLVIGVFLVSLLIFVDYDDDNIFFFIELFMMGATLKTLKRNLSFLG